MKQLDTTDPKEVANVCAYHNLRKTARVVTQMYDDLLRPTGLRATQFPLLVALQARGPLTVNELAEAVVSDPTTMTRNLRPLQKRGLVRIDPGEDRRVRVVSLTRTGKTTVNKALPHWQQAQRRMVKGLRPERLMRLLSDLSVAIETARPA